MGDGPNKGSDEVVLAARIHAQVVELATQDQVDDHLGGAIGSGLP